MVKNKWYLRKHLVTAHGAPLKRAKGSSTEPKNPEANEKDTLKVFQKNENVFELSEGQTPGLVSQPNINQKSDEHHQEKHVEKPNEEDNNEELNVDN